MNPLRVFEAAARHGSFTRAATELHVTQGAVSQAVRALEEHLGEKLFLRGSDGLHLTSGGAEYARTVRDAFRDIAEATAMFRNSRSGPIVTIRAYTSFLTYWLFPRMPCFQANHPDIEVRCIAANDRVRLDRDPVDLRVRYGTGRWRGMNSVLLVPDELTPVVSPGLLPFSGAPYPPQHLARFTWLESSQRRADWPEWLCIAGVPDLRPTAATIVEELSIVYRLAIAGAGVALGNRIYLVEEFASGRLHCPVESVLRREAGYHLTWSRDSAPSTAATLFRNWVTAAANRHGRCRSVSTAHSA